MIQGSIARRYARALFHLGVEEDRYEAIGEELERTAAAMDASAEMRDVLTNPAFATPQRHAALDAIAGPLGIGETTARALHLMIDRRRIADLAGIARAYRELADEKSGRVRCTVTTAVELAASDQVPIESGLAALTGADVVVETGVEPALIGGVVARVGSTVYDGSLATQLVRLKQQLKLGPSARG